MKNEDKGGGDTTPPKMPKPVTLPKESFPKFKVFPSEKIFRRKSTFDGDHGFKQKGSSSDSTHHKVSRTGSQTKRKISPSDAFPKRRMSASDPKFQRRISLTEFPGSKLSPGDSPPYQKLGSSDPPPPPLPAKKMTKRRLSKALTLTHDPTYHHENSSEYSPSPSSVRKFFFDSTGKQNEENYSSSSLSPFYQPKSSSVDVSSHAISSGSISRDSSVSRRLHYDIPSIKATSVSTSTSPTDPPKDVVRRDHSTLSFKEKKIPIQSKKEASETQPLLPRSKHLSETPFIYRQMSVPEEPASQESSLLIDPSIEYKPHEAPRITKHEVTPDFVPQKSPFGETISRASSEKRSKLLSQSSASPEKLLETDIDHQKQPDTDIDPKRPHKLATDETRLRKRLSPPRETSLARPKKLPETSSVAHRSSQPLSTDEKQISCPRSLSTDSSTHSYHPRSLLLEGVHKEKTPK